MLDAVVRHCPYCGEPIELLVEPGPDGQHYIEDCQVCCRPIQVHVAGGGSGVPQVWLTSENEV
jgi:hypothetical protein